MLSLIILLPFFGFLSGSLFGKIIGGKGIGIISTIFVFCSFSISFYFFFDILSNGNVYILTFSKWIEAETFQVDWSMCLDSLTSIMLLVITFISTLVHLYSTEYMENDPHLTRFLSYLSLFTFFMLILVVADNFLQMFVGWEGVGVSSYLLINFWFTRIQANKAAIKAMLVNRIGDFALLLAIFCIFFVFNSLDYDVVFSLAPLIIDYRILIGGLEVPVLDFVSYVFLFIFCFLTFSYYMIDINWILLVLHSKLAFSWLPFTAFVSYILSQQGDRHMQALTIFLASLLQL